MTVAQTDPRGDSLVDDSGDGPLMLLIFTGAVLIVTGAVALLALVGSWWVLGLAIAIHVVMTVVVVTMIASVMGGRILIGPRST